MKDELRRRRDKLAREIEMMKNDVEHWNRVHPGEKPIDAEEHIAGPRALLAKIDRQLGSPTN